MVDVMFQTCTLYKLATPVASGIDRLVPDTAALMLIPDASESDSDSTDLMRCTCTMQSSCVRVGIPTALCGGRG